MPLKKVICFFACLAFFGGLSGYSVKDIDGNIFEFPQPPKIASITPSVSETICELGALDNLLGVSRYCEYPPLLRQKTKLGGFVDPDYEKILTLRPDLVVMPKTSDAKVRERLKRLNIPCFLIYPDGIENVSKNVLLIGEILQKKEEAAKIAAEIEAEIRPVRNTKKPKAVLLFGKMAAGKGSFAGGLLERAGFENIASKASNPWPVLSREFILLNQPEVIILEVKGGESFESLALSLKNDPLWGITSAARNGKIYSIDSQIIIVPGPRLVKAAKHLKKIAAEEGGTAGDI